MIYRWICGTGGIEDRCLTSVQPDLNRRKSFFNE